MKILTRQSMVQKLIKNSEKYFNLIILTLSITILGLPGLSKAQSLENFEKWAKGFVENPTNEVVLANPEVWFSQHFDSETAKKLAAEYKTQSRNAEESLKKFFQKTKASGRTQLRVFSVSKPIDMNATGCQNAALQRMTKPVTLLTLRMVKPGKDLGSSLWSFVEDGKGYKFVGKMTALKPEKTTMMTDVLCQMPLVKIEKVMKEKGMLKTSAVAYLQSVGLLFDEQGLLTRSSPSALTSEKEVSIPEFKVDVNLSELAENKLRSLKETVLVSVVAFGDAKPNSGVELNEMDQLDLVQQRMDSKDKGMSMKVKLDIPQKKFDALANQDYEVLVNVFSARRSDPKNLLSCGIVQGKISELKDKTHIVPCKLIGE